MRMMLLGVLLCWSAVASSADTEVRPDLIFLCIGQSNMAGRASLLPEDHQGLEGVLLLTRDGRWEPARHPLNRYASDQKSPAKQRFGPSGSFAQAVRAAFPDKHIGLIVNARGSSKIAAWGKGAKLYRRSLARVASAKVSVDGVLWLQGYSDRTNAQYQAELTGLLAALRADLKDPQLPVIIGEPPVPEDAPVISQIRSLDDQWARTVPNTGLSKFDHGHYDRDSYIRMGQGMAQAWLELTAGQRK